MAEKDLTVEEKLRRLYRLQLIDLHIEELRNIRGELPLEVQDLEDEIVGLESRLSKINKEVENLTKEISVKKSVIQESKDKIKVYSDKKSNLKSGREFESIEKEIEYENLEIEFSEKKIKDFSAQLDIKNEQIVELKAHIAFKKVAFKHKHEDLEKVLADTKKEETILQEKAEEISEGIEERLLKAYHRIKDNVVNKMAVVPVERGASGGSFFVIPLQVQVEIAARTKIITDEHSGRILVDAALAEEEKANMKEFFDSL